MYSFLVTVFDKILPFLGFLGKKYSQFASGRRQSFAILEQHCNAANETVWTHCASLGEYEQAVPILQEIKRLYPDFKILVTFFSPSGYEIKKNSGLAHVYAYLPLDSPANVDRLLAIVNPKLALFIKYEFWPNYFKALYRRRIPVLMVAAVFRPNQIFFRSYGQFMRRILAQVHHFFVQNQESADLLHRYNFTNVTVSGDTRFDRVHKQLKMHNTVDFIQAFIQDRLCVVIGSSWPEDEAVFVDFINSASEQICFIIAPHQVDRTAVQHLVSKIKIPTVCYTQKKDKNLATQRVFVMDTIGYLSRIYHYGHIAYVGGGMGTTGLHNILEAATFGLPIIIGKNYQDFWEAKALLQLGGLFSVTTADGFRTIMNRLLKEVNFRKQVSAISADFVKNNTGATASILSYIQDLHIDHISKHENPY